MQLLLAVALMSSAVINRPVLNMYSGPSEDRDPVSQAIYGATVEILETEGGWHRVRTPDDYTGWVPASGVLQPGRKYPGGGRVAEVSSLMAHLYRVPSVTKHQPLLTVPFETRLEVIDEPKSESGRWISVRLPDEREAWIQRGDVTFEPRKLSIDEMVTLAKRFLGLPYTWAGTSSFGYDCSGYTQMLCRRRGLNLPRDAGPQAAWSGVRPVSTVAELQPGDLLYFGKSAESIDHTGLYIGDGEFIHATTRNTPVVQISRVEDWTRTLVAMRRPK